MDMTAVLLAKQLSGGGGGTTYTAGDGIDITNDEISIDGEFSGRVGTVEGLLGGHSVGKAVPSDAVFTDTVYDDTAVRGLIAQKQDIISDLVTIRSGAGLGATAEQPPALVSVTVDSTVTQTLADNTEYSVLVEDGGEVTFGYLATGECWMRLTVDDDAVDYSVAFASGWQFIGSDASGGFEAGDVYEISFKDGVAVMQKVGDGE